MAKSYDVAHALSEPATIVIHYFKIKVINEMLNFIRKLLRRTPLYFFAAKIYHFGNNQFMRLRLIFSPVKYLRPINVRGDYKSQFGQDYYLEKLGLLVPNGFFVEIGCNHPVLNSNSYYLEKKLGWKGVSIDGIDYSDLYLAERENTVFVNVLINEKEDELDFYHVKDVEGWENQISSVYPVVLESGKGFDAEVVKVKALPLSKINQINRAIDLCLIDVEGHELSVLRSMDFINNSPRVFVIENVGDFYPRQLLVSFLQEKGYKHVARIGTRDDIFVLHSVQVLSA